MPEGLPRPRTLLLIVGLFVWFASGVEAWRRGDWSDVRARPTVLVSQPWKGLRAFVSREGDDRLYHQYAELMVGRPGDLAFIARKSQGDPQAALARLQPLVRPGPGWRLPYRDFPVEYPPVPLALMLAPRLVVESLPAYRVALAACLGLLFLATCWVGARLAACLAPPGAEPVSERVWRRMAWLALAMGPLLVARFDLLPALLVAAALYALARRRDLLAGALAGLAVMTKLYPLLLLLPLGALLWGAGERARVLRVSAVAAASSLLLALPFLLTAPERFLRAVALYGERPLHFESLLGALVLVTQGPAAVVGSHGSHNVATPVWLGRLADLSLWVALLALATLALRAGTALRRDRADDAERARALAHWVFAGLTAILCLSKVLSPQFMTWLLPLAAVFAQPADVRGRQIFVVTFAVSALTHLFFPVFHGAAQAGSVFAQALLLGRNAGLVLLAVLAAASAAGVGRAALGRGQRARVQPAQ
jgi:hypothetical protein